MTFFFFSSKNKKKPVASPFYNNAEGKRYSNPLVRPSAAPAGFGSGRFPNRFKCSTQWWKFHKVNYIFLRQFGVKNLERMPSDVFAASLLFFIEFSNPVCISH